MIIPRDHNNKIERFGRLSLATNQTKVGASVWATEGGAGSVILGSTVPASTVAILSPGVDFLTGK